MLKATTKVRAKNKFELMYYVRKREKSGWKRGKIEHIERRYKDYNYSRYGFQYAGDNTVHEWICYMEKTYAEMDVKQ